MRPSFAKEMNMYMEDFQRTEQASTLILCPHCGASEYEDNRIDEQIYVEAAHDAHCLRHEGRIAEAIDVLSALYAIRISNFVKPRWLCLVCGVRFDD